MRRVVVVLFAACAALAAVAVPAAAASGNEAAKDASDILADARAATAGARTVRIAGEIHTDGRDITLDIVSGHGTGGGTIAVDGATFDIVVRPPDVYMKGGARTWRKLTGSKVAAQLFADRWLKTASTNPDFESFAKLVDVEKLTAALEGSGPIDKGRTTTYKGVAAIPLVDGDGSGVLYVAARGKPYIVGIVDKKGRGALRFTDYGTAKVPKVPKRSVDLSQLTPTTTSAPAQSA